MLFPNLAARHPDATDLVVRLLQLLHHARQQIEHGEHAVAYDDLCDSMNVLNMLAGTVPDWKKANVGQIRARLLPISMVPMRPRAPAPLSFSGLVQRI